MSHIHRNTDIIIVKRYTPAMVKNDPHKLFIFGDNLDRQGIGGQAIIRGFYNTYGIPTKRRPSMSNTAFFSDKEEEFEAICNSIHDLYIIYRSKVFHSFVFPEDGLGTGFSDMPSHSPKIYAAMNILLYTLFGVYGEKE